MKIKSINIYRLKPRNETWLLLCIETYSGIIGWGEITDSSSDENVVNILAEITPELIGKDPRDIINCNSVFKKWSFPPNNLNRFISTAISGVDQALWDITSQSFNLPLYCMLGVYGDKEIPLYANLNRGLRSDRSTESLVSSGVSAVKNGFEVVKCTPFDEVKPNRDMASYKMGLERIKALAEQIPIENIAIDCHQRFNRGILAQFLDELLSSLGTPYWVEDIFEWERNTDFNVINNYYPQIRWAYGETCLSIQHAYQMIGSEYIDVFMPDVKHAGGVSALKVIIPFAEENGRWVSLHNPSGPVSTAFSAHIMTLCKNKIPLEFPWEVVEDRKDATIEPEPISNGKYYLTDKPGIGVSPKEEYIREYGEIYKEGKWIPLKNIVKVFSLK